MYVSAVRRPLAVLVAFAVSLSLLVLSGAGLSSAGAATAIRPYALTKGHIDLFEVTYDEAASGLGLKVKDDTNLYDQGTQYRDPATVSVVVDAEESAVDVSGTSGAFAFLKVDGDTVYQLPQTQDIDLPWPGWSTERLMGTLPAGSELPASGQPVQLDVEVEGPGNVFTWQTGTFGGVQNKYVDTVDPGADVIPIARNAHVHTNWAFTKPGDYLLTVTPSATTTGGGTLTGQPASYHFHVGDAGDIAEDGLHILGLAGHYHSGSPITLDAALVPEDDTPATYRWSTRRADQEAFQVAESVTGTTFTMTAEQALDQMSVKVERVVEGSVTEASVPVTVLVDDHGAPAPQTVTISGETAYDEGETVALTANVAPATVLDRYQWYLTPAGSTTPEAIDEATSSTYEFTAAAAHDGATVTVAVTGEDGTVVYGPSTPHTLSVTPAVVDPEPVATSISTGAVKQVYGKAAKLTVSVSPNASGRVTVKAGTRTVSGTLSNGRATVTLPARALAPGKRSVTVSYAGVEDEFEPSAATAAVTVVKATPKVKVKAPAKVKRGKTATFAITVTGVGVKPGGKVTVKVAGRSRTVTLNKLGRATVRIGIKKSAKRGKVTALVTYAGDARVAKGTARAAVRITR